MDDSPPTTSKTQLKAKSLLLEDEQKDDKSHKPPHNIHRRRAEAVMCACLGRGRVQAVQTVFRHMGTIVGRRPIPFIVLSVLFTLAASSGGYKFRITQDLHTGYLSPQSPAHREKEIALDFYSLTAQPYMASVRRDLRSLICIIQMIIIANDNGSLMREKYFDEIETVNNYLMHNITVHEEGKNYTFQDLCGDFCKSNDPVWTFKHTLQSSSPLPPSTDLQYPISHVYAIPLNMAPYFYGTQSNFSNPKARTSITDLHIVSLWYASSENRNATMESVLYKWELAMDAYLKENYSKESPLIRCLPNGYNSISAEVMSAGMSIVPYYSLGMFIMLVFIAITVSAGAFYHGVLSPSCITITLTAVISPCLAAAATFGVFTWANEHTNLMMLIAPFLILAIGVDDAFLLVHSWQRVCISMKTMTRAAKLGQVIAETGPSILITSVTNTLAFSIGAIVSPAEIRLFCATVAVAMMIAFVFQITFFCPIMMLTAKDDLVTPSSPQHFGDTSVVHQSASSTVQPGGGPQSTANGTTAHRSASPPYHGSPSKIAAAHVVVMQPNDQLTFAGWQPCKTNMQAGLVLYSRFVTSHAGRMLAVILFGIYMAAAVTGIMLMKAEMFPEDLMPEGSRLIEMIGLKHRALWKEYDAVNVVVNKRLNYSNPEDVLHLKSLVNDMETLPNSLGPHFTQFWLRDYESYRERNLEWFAVDGKEIVPLANNTISLDLLPDFLADSMFAHYKSQLLLTGGENGTELGVDRFMFRVAHANVTSLGNRAAFVHRWRVAIWRYNATLDASLWDPEAPHSDIIQMVRGITLTTLLITLASMAAVCSFFIPNIAALLVAVASIASICAGVMGLLSWWGARLDPVTMADLIISIGFSVDFTAHISYHYYTAGTQHGQITGARRMHDTFIHVLYPMLQAGASTMICMLPQLVSPMPAHKLFVKTIMLVVACGLAHGCFFIPVVLGVLPDTWTTGDHALDNQGDSTEGGKELMPLKANGDAVGVEDNKESKGKGERESLCPEQEEPYKDTIEAADR